MPPEQENKGAVIDRFQRHEQAFDEFDEFCA